ncbi:hypothetical protein KKD52_11250 [Myxococcota bacterium]|nr:hypothetical protein [Myxococcota bacterium]MBU1412420.1 hypothetical protein [Myxococcota bacterium]MBU1510928.1 hypothetical protein [Myxococcota bacterium]
MKRPRWRMPSPGFVLILLTLAATAGLFAWGLQEPQLHRAWDLTARLEREDATPPTAREITAVSRVLAAYPEWATTIADGRPFAMLEAPGSGCIRFETSHLMVPPSEGPVRLVLTCPGADGLDVSITPPGAAPVSAQCGPQPQVLSIPGAGTARLVSVHRSPGPNYGDDRTCPVFLTPRPEDLAAAPAPEPPAQEEGDDAAKD